MKPTSPAGSACRWPPGAAATPPTSATTSPACSPYLAGEPVPALPAGEHPDDLLTDKEVAAVLGITPGTVRAYASQGYLSGGTTVYGTRLWPRREVNERRDNPPGQGKGGGRRAGEPQGPRKQYPYEGDPRLQTAADALATANGAPKGRIAAEHGGTTRTWERLLTAAAAVQDDTPDSRLDDGHEARA